MRREEKIKILMFLSKLEGFARGTHKNEMLPDDMWDEMEYVTGLLVEDIKGVDHEHTTQVSKDCKHRYTI